MKKYLVLLLLSLGLSMSSTAVTYYTCATSGQNTTNSNGTSGCIASTAWNTSGNILVVRSGTTLNLTGAPFNLNGSIQIQQGGSVVFNSGSSANNNNNAFNILANAVVIVNGTFQITSQNTKLSISSAGLLVVNSTGTLSNLASGNSDIIVEGNITGSGTIEWTGGISGSGTINGRPPSGTSPIDLDQIGFIWNGTSWSPSAPVNPIDRAIFNGNYSSIADAAVPAIWPSDAFTVNDGVTVSFDDNDNLAKIVSAKIDGILEMVDNVTINSAVFADPSSVGSISIERNFSRQGWQHFGLPLKATSTATLGDIVTTGITFNYTSPPSNQTIIYYWDAATAGWLVPTSSSLLAGKAFNLFTLAGSSMSITVPVANFNNDPIVQTYTYFNPGTNPPGNGTGWTNTVTDGWNMWMNPFQSYIESDDLNVAVPGDIVGGVYVWDGSQYLTRNGGSGAAEFIGPHQAFFVRTDGGSNAFLIPESVRNANPITKPNYFKTGTEIELLLSGQGVNAKTFIVENVLSTNGFDANFDAFYFFGANTVFNSVGADSNAYSVNQLPNLQGKDVYVSFYHPTSNKNFTISIDQSKATAFASVVLTDLHTSTMTDLKSGDYNFTSNTAAPVQRFKLHFSQSSIGIAEQEDGNNFKVWINNNELRFDDNANLEGATISVYNMSGQIIAKGTTENTIYVDNAGVYVVNVNTIDGHSYNTKVVKL